MLLLGIGIGIGSGGIGSSCGCALLVLCVRCGDLLCLGTYCTVRALRRRVSRQVKSCFASQFSSFMERLAQGSRIFSDQIGRTSRPCLFFVFLFLFLEASSRLLCFALLSLALLVRHFGAGWTGLD